MSEENKELDRIFNDINNKDEDVSLNSDAIASVIKYINNDREKAQEAFNYFRNRLEVANDNRQATKEAMMKSLEIKNKTIDQLLKLLELQVKLITAQKEEASDDIYMNMKTGEVRITSKRDLIKKIEEGEI